MQGLLLHDVALNRDDPADAFQAPSLLQILAVARKQAGAWAPCASVDLVVLKRVELAAKKVGPKPTFLFQGKWRIVTR
jgi:hypothetical protein